MTQEISADYWNHETRIRLMEELNKRVENRFDKIESKIDSHFHWTIGAIISILIATIGIIVGVR